MVNIDTLPKCIEFNDDWYSLNLHVTAFNKLCISYQYMGGARRALDNKKEYNILSQVVEPDMTHDINYTNEVTGIVDVPNYEIGFNILSTRLNMALSENKVTIIYK